MREHGRSEETLSCISSLVGQQYGNFDTLMSQNEVVRTHLFQGQPVLLSKHTTIWVPCSIPLLLQSVYFARLCKFALATALAQLRLFGRKIEYATEVDLMGSELE